MFCSFTNFKNWYEKAEDVFKKFEENMSTFMSKRSNTASYSKMVSNTTSQLKTNYHYLPLKNRLEQLFKIR
jgi:UDP:flavonoid glycosyltransferase YjiC (YdhE family)